MLECSRHGKQVEAFVCRHVLAGLHSKTRVGFCWSADDESPRPDAWCPECDQRVKATAGEWTPEVVDFAGPKLLCGLCYDEARKLNLEE